MRMEASINDLNNLTWPRKTYFGLHKSYNSNITKDVTENGPGQIRGRPAESPYYSAPQGTVGRTYLVFFPVKYSLTFVRPGKAKVYNCFLARIDFAPRIGALYPDRDPHATPR